MCTIQIQFYTRLHNIYLNVLHSMNTKKSILRSSHILYTLHLTILSAPHPSLTPQSYKTSLHTKSPTWSFNPYQVSLFLRNCLTLLGYNDLFCYTFITSWLPWIAWCARLDIANASFLYIGWRKSMWRFLDWPWCYEWQYIMWCKELKTQINKMNPVIVWWEKDICTASILRPSLTYM